jgi:hypothetical protein
LGIKDSRGGGGKLTPVMGKDVDAITMVLQVMEQD